MITMNYVVEMTHQSNGVAKELSDVLDCEEFGTMLEALSYAKRIMSRNIGEGLLVYILPCNESLAPVVAWSSSMQKWHLEYTATA